MQTFAFNCIFNEAPNDIGNLKLVKNNCLDFACRPNKTIALKACALLGVHPAVTCQCNFSSNNEGQQGPFSPIINQHFS